AERHVEVGVNIDATRHHVFARRIENARGVLLRQVHADGMNLSIHDCDVGSVSIGRGNNSSVLDKSIKGHEGSGKAGNRRFYAMLPKFPAYHLDRITMHTGPKLTPEQLEENFADINPPLTPSLALEAASRCLFCYDAP